MKIFIIHKSQDADLCYLFKDYLQKTTKSEVLVLENAGRLWKIEAKRLIKKAQMILFLSGEKRSKYVDWEIKSAIALNKPVLTIDLLKYSGLSDTIKDYENSRRKDDANGLNDEVIEKSLKLLNNFELSLKESKKGEFSEYPKNETLFCKNKFTKDLNPARVVSFYDTISDVAERIEKYNAGDYDVFNLELDKISRNELMDQYKFYLQTSETLVARRQSVNTFYISVNAAIITLASTGFALCSNINEKLIIAIGAAATGIILDFSWMKILEAYGILNASKMKIVSLIERKLPLSLYDQEWVIMSDKLNSRKYVSFTDSEKRIPKMFLCVYLLALITIGIVLLINR